MQDLEKNINILSDLDNYEKEDFWLWGKSFLTSTLRFLFLSMPTTFIFLYCTLSDRSRIFDESLRILPWVLSSYLLSVPFNFMLDKIWIKFKEIINRIITKA